MGWFTRYRWLLMAAVVGIGLVTVIEGGRLETRNPQSNLEDEVALSFLAVGMCLIGAGVSLPSGRPMLVILSAITFPAIGWLLLVLCYYVALSQDRWPSQEQMVPSGYEMILEARQIDDLLGPARHQLANYTEPDIAEWQTEVLFGGRYELMMTVSVRVDRGSGRVTEIVGEPRFMLSEITEIWNSREVLYGGPGQREFGVDQWRRVVKAGGDFSVIGIKLNYNHPVPGFESFQAGFSNGIQMRRDGRVPVAVHDDVRNADHRTPSEK
jgi:hypothetical protein